VDKVGILVIDDDVAGQATLRQILESEAWELHAEPVATKALQELATGAWTLVIASVGLTGLAGPLYATLRELALAPLSEEGKARLRVLFVIPETADQQARSTIESEHLPYVQKPFNLHDLLERVSDLLMETEAIATPIRRVREQGLLGSRSVRTGRSAAASRNTGMFASRSEYSMTEEEIAEYERHETEEMLRKKKKLPGME
jgi:DNA-binding response OmpR family regulator